jgi:hypothetical protein
MTTMAKTLKDFLNERQLGPMVVKNPDEQKFIDKHVVAKTDDRNGNDDELFKGSKVKMADRPKHRKGYNPGEDEEVYEDHNAGYYVMRNGQSISYHKDKESADKRARTANMRGGSNATVVKDDKKMSEELKGNQHKIDANKNGKVDAHDFHLLRKKKKVAEEAEGLDELSRETVRTYYNKAGEQGKKIADKMKMVGGDFSSDGSDTKTLKKRAAGRTMALKRRSGEMKMSEDSELEEKLDMKKASMGTVVKDFQKSDAPQFMGKSQKKRQVMAIAAKLSAERGGKPLNKEERLLTKLADISETHKRTMISVFEKLNEDNQREFMLACDTAEGIEQMLDFSIQHRGE